MGDVVKPIMLKHILVVVAVVMVMTLVTSGTRGKGAKLNQKRHNILEKSLKEKRQPVIRAECLPTEFACASGYCIPLDKVCDTHHNCPAGDDEQNCPTNCTGPHQFKCENSHKCIGLVDRCDGSKDCTDYSDEANCESFVCPAGRFKCETSHECLDRAYVCDHDRDCQDGSDEHNCVNGSCSSNQFECADGSKCVPQFYVCDGDVDCYDRSDEHGCSCSSSQLQCKNGLCIPNRYRCDGYNDCGDMSDEIDCPVDPPSVCHNVLSYHDCLSVNETTHPICLIPDDADKFCREFCGLCQN